MTVTEPDVSMPAAEMEESLVNDSTDYSFSTPNNTTKSTKHIGFTKSTKMSTQASVVSNDAIVLQLVEHEESTYE